MVDEKEDLEKDLENEEKEIVAGLNFRLRLRFLYRPEYLEENTRLMIRDSFMTAVGVVSKVLPDQEGDDVLGFNNRNSIKAADA